MVSDISEFSIRGDIADIYSLNPKPVRIELWGDEVVDIRYFDNQTQKSVEKATQTTILPVYKFITAGQEDTVKKIQQNLIDIDNEIPEENYFEGIEVYQNFFMKLPKFIQNTNFWMTVSTKNLKKIPSWI